jgi:hypothetical protein
MRVIGCFVLFLFIGQMALFGQYESIRLPQKKEEIELLKSNKIKKEFKYVLDKGNKKILSTISYDTLGKIFYVKEDRRQKTFTYYPNGLIRWIYDSVLSPDDVFHRTDYYFEYDKQNRIEFYRCYTSNIFRWSKDGRSVEEGALVDYDSYIRRYYTFDSKGNKLTERFLRGDSTLEKYETHSYNKEGKLILDKIHHYNVSGNHDSTSIKYIYNGDKKLIKKAYIQYDYVLKDTLNGKGWSEEIDSFNYTYSYNKDGKLLAEDYHYSNPEYNFSNKFIYFGNGQKMKDLFYEGMKPKLKSITYYDYLTYDGKKLSADLDLPKPKKTNTVKNYPINKGIKPITKKH